MSLFKTSLLLIVLVAQSLIPARAFGGYGYGAGLGGGAAMSGSLLTPPRFIGSDWPIGPGQFLVASLFQYLST